jgi:glyoxylase-like metal-dependent hydrolase (beta-lactamase superfamily II)
MARVLGAIGALVILLAGIGAVWVYDRVTTFDVQRVSDDVHVISNGIAGNVGVLRTELGAVVVDTMTFRLQGQQVRELARRLGGGPTQAILNTHYHRDHTHGNPAFAAGGRFVATKRTLDYLMHWDSDYWQGGTAGMLPNETFEQSHEMKIGGKTIRSYHPGSGHTGGDLVVLFVEDRVLHAGDLLFHREYPSIDLGAGGSARDWDAALSRVLRLDFDRVIPGHGPVTDREGLLAFQRFLREVWREVEAAVKAGKSLEETLATIELSEDEDFEIKSIPFIMTRDRDFVVRLVYAEASGEARPIGVPRSTSKGRVPGRSVGLDTAATAVAAEDVGS